MEAAKTKSRKRSHQLPPPLPPGTRTIGQLVAETIRFYGRHFWRSLVLGLAPAGLADAGYAVGFHPWLAAVVVGWVLVASASYVAACVIVHGRPTSASAARTAFLAGIIVVLPMLVGLVWFAPIGLAVPAALVEAIPLRRALRRGLELARVDYVHALGSLFTLALVVFLTQVLLTALLHGGSQQSTYVSAFLANLVVSPILFLGAALLYTDQQARVELQSGLRTRRRGDADVSHAHDPDRPGSADSPVAS
jgi:hypothetical protein